MLPTADLLNPLLATDGLAQSDGALRMAELLNGDANTLRVVTVVKPVPIVSPEVQLPVSEAMESERRTMARNRVSEQVGRVLRGCNTTVQVEHGDPSSTVAAVARESGAAMIVAGQGRHRLADRIFGDETALGLARAATVPVYAVAQHVTQRPRRIVVAIDFTDTSVRAAQLAVRVAAPGATLYLTHVAPDAGKLYAPGGWGVSYKSDAAEWLAGTREQLTVPQGTNVQRLILQGDAATELLAFAASVNADLIALGSHGHGAFTRMLIGSVATHVLRTAMCSVLVVPPAAVPAESHAAPCVPVVTPVFHPEWSATLDAFTRRNIGRRGVLEVDDPDLGAQAQERDYPLCGATYDPRDQCVEIMLGELGDVDRHLTRSIGGVTSIDLLTNGSGRDVALRIAHGAGQTLLTFRR